MKRIIGLALTGLLLLTFLPVGAVGSVYFTAANDNVLDLTDDTMPFWSGGLIYVPSTIFSGTNLGVFCAQNPSTKLLTLYNIQKNLFFDLNSGTCYDQDSVSYSYRAITRNSKAYVPISFVCSYFGLTYSYLQAEPAPVIRIKSKSAVLSDGVFLNAAAQLMQYRYSQYSGGQTPVVSETPVSPSPSPSGGGTGPEQHSAVVYLAFDGGPAEYTGQILDALDQYNDSAAFFLRADRLEGGDALVRRIVGSGYPLGLSASADQSAEALLKELAEGNRLLARISCTQTRLVLVPGITEEQSALLRKAGYCVWTPSVNAEYAGTSAYQTSAKAFRALNGRRESRVRFATSAVGADAALRFLRLLQNGGYSVSMVTEQNAES